MFESKPSFRWWWCRCVFVLRGKGGGEQVLMTHAPIEAQELHACRNYLRHPFRNLNRNKTPEEFAADRVEA